LKQKQAANQKPIAVIMQENKNFEDKQKEIMEKHIKKGEIKESFSVEQDDFLTYENV
jgi:hypothetical protein